jgi:hypothetical protein
MKENEPLAVERVEPTRFAPRQSVTLRAVRHRRLDDRTVPPSLEGDRRRSVTRVAKAGVWWPPPGVVVVVVVVVVAGGGEVVVAVQEIVPVSQAEADGVAGTYRRKVPDADCAPVKRPSNESWKSRYEKAFRVMGAPFHTALSPSATIRQLPPFAYFPCACRMR